MAEELALTAPIIKPSNLSWRIRRVDKDLDRQLILVGLRGTNNEYKEFEYKGDQALTFIRILNKTNNSIKSEERRILEKLILDFPELAGSITGSPD